MAKSLCDQATRSNGENAGNDDNSNGRSIPAQETASDHRNQLNLNEFISNNKDSWKHSKSNNITIVRSNKLVHALDLPTILNLNPRSVYNKINEFHSLVEEEEADIIFMSESWERENKTLDQIVNLADHIVISNVHQRRGVGGRPALIINKSKYIIQNLTQSIIKIPWGVEVVWAMITPKHVQSDSKIQKIVLGAVYSKPNSKKKSATLDHISDVFNHMSVKHKKGLHFNSRGHK